jgi:predicted phosphodiesterase
MFTGGFRTNYLCESSIGGNVFFAMSVLAVWTPLALFAGVPLNASLDSKPHPWTHLNFQNDPDDFQFAIVPDRTGGDYRGAFTNALEKINRMHPEFVMTVGDLVEGMNMQHVNARRTVADVQVEQLTELTNMTAKVVAPFFTVVGNHDIETGHPVYDRVIKQMETPFLAANALDAGTGKPYFQEYVLLKRHSLKIAVIGFTNPNIAGWLSPELWEEPEFRNLLPYAQEVVDRVHAEAEPDVVIVAAHTGAGDGDGARLENQGLDLYKSLRGVDFVVCAHDHKPRVHQNDSICLINSGAHCRNLGHGAITLTVKDGKVVSKVLEGGLIPVDPAKADDVMRTVEEKYLAVYPALKGKYLGALCDSADGVKL